MQIGKIIGKNTLEGTNLRRANMREWERFKQMHESGILEVTEDGVAFSILKREQWLSRRF